MRKFVTVLLLTIMAAGVGGNANAQFWKKRVNKKHKHKHGQVITEPDLAETTLTHEQKKMLRKKEKRERKMQKRERRRMHKKKTKVRAEVMLAPDEGDNHIPALGSDRAAIKMERESENEAKESEAVTRKERKTEVKLEKKRRKKEPLPMPVVAKERKFAFPHTTFKPFYRIDVLTQMYLDELVKDGSASFSGKIPEKAVPGMDFYKGVQIAADSLKNAGYSIDIYIHDVTSATESAEKLVSGKKLDSADLIIGAVTPRDLPTLAGYAKRKQVNFVSAFSPADGGVKDNHYFTMTQPSLQGHCEWIVDDVTKKFPGQQVALLYRTSVPVDNNAYKYVTGAGGTEFRQLECNTVPDKQSLSQLFSLAKPNIVIVPILDKGYADSLLAALAQDFPSTHFEVYGMPSWLGSKTDEYDNISIDITSPFDFSKSSPVVQYVNRKYKKDYGDKQTELVYRGFETLMWYAYLLKQHGTIFNENYSDNAGAPFTQFEVKPEFDKEGNFLFYENKHIYFFSQDGGVSKAE